MMNTAELTKRIIILAATAIIGLVPFQALAISTNDLHAINNDTNWYDPLSCDPPGATSSGDSSASSSDSSSPANALSTATTDQKIAQTFIVGFDNGQEAAAEQAVKKYHLGGVFVLGKASSTEFTPTFFSDLDKAAGIPLLDASDEEGGQVQRFNQVAGVGSFPSARQVASMSTSDVEALGKRIGSGLKSAGINADLAPVLDLLTNNVNNADNLGNPSQSRSYSADPSVIAAKAGAFAKGLNSSGVMPVLKHFPGIGQLTGNTDTSPGTLPSLSQLKNSLAPYKSIANDNGAAVMLSNAYVPDWGSSLPTSVNPAAVKFLRGAPYSFNGLIMTDALNALSQPAYGSRAIDLPTAVSKALLAGVQMPLFAYNGDAGLQSIIDKVKAAVPDSTIASDDSSILGFKNVPDQPTASSSSSCCPTGSAGSTSPVASGSDNEETIWNNLIAVGMQPFQAAGIMGNMQSESGFDPYVLQNTSSSGGDSFNPADAGDLGWGLVQWTPGAKVIPYFNGQPVSHDKNTAITQEIKALSSQLNGQGASAEKAAGDAIKASTNVDQAAAAFEQDYERHGGPPQQARIDQAAAILKLATDKHWNTGGGSVGVGTGTGTDPTSGSTCGTATTTGSSGGCTGGVELPVPAGGAGVKTCYFDQADLSGGGYDWQGCGCLPTSALMIRATMEGSPKLSPTTVLDGMRSHGAVASDGCSGVIGGELSYLKSLNYQIKEIATEGTPLTDSDLNQIKQFLSQGYLIQTHTSVSVDSAGSQSTTGHFLLIQAVDAQGNFYMANPGARADNGTKVSPSRIKAWLNMAYAIKK